MAICAWPILLRARSALISASEAFPKKSAAKASSCWIAVLLASSEKIFRRRKQVESAEMPQSPCVLKLVMQLGDCHWQHSVGSVLTLMADGSKRAVLLALGLCDDEELVTLTHGGNAACSWCVKWMLAGYCRGCQWEGENRDLEI